MLIYAIVINNSILEYRNYEYPPKIRYYDGLPIQRPVVFIPSPSFNPSLEKLVKIETIFSDRVEISYQIVSLTQLELDKLAEELASIIQEQKDKQTILDIKVENLVKQFIKMDEQEINDYIQTNVTDLNSAKTILKFYGRLLLVLTKVMKREFY